MLLQNIESLDVQFPLSATEIIDFKKNHPRQVREFLLEDDSFEGLQEFFTALHLERFFLAHNFPVLDLGSEGEKLSNEEIVYSYLRSQFIYKFEFDPRPRLINVLTYFVIKKDLDAVKFLIEVNQPSECE